MGIGKSGLQKAIFNLRSLPPLTIINDKLGYYVKYRFISEDKNRTSHWSPTYPITANFDFRRPIDPSTGNEISNVLTSPVITNVSGKRFVTLAWDPVSAYINDNFITRALGYDIWVKWYSNTHNNGVWEYEERITQTSITLLAPSSFVSTDIDPVTHEPAIYSGTNRLQVEIYARQLEPSRSSGVGDPKEQTLFYKSLEINV